MAQNTADMDMLSIETLNDAAACLKVMAHPVRLRIVDILMQGEFSVREIAEMCETQQNQICEHLRHMQSCGFLTSERRGRTVYYRILSLQLPLLIDCIKRHCGSANNDSGGED